MIDHERGDSDPGVHTEVGGAGTTGAAVDEFGDEESEDDERDAGDELDAGDEPDELDAGDEIDEDVDEESDEDVDEESEEQEESDEYEDYEDYEEDLSTAERVLDVCLRAIVDEPDEIEIHRVGGHRRLTLHVRVAPDDMGKIIGKRGRVANALRTLVKAAGARDNQSAMVEIED